MSAERSRSQIDHHRMSMHMARDLLGRMNELEQAEKIASHYLRHAAHAQQLLKIVEMTRYTKLTDDTKGVIKYMADEIRRNHAYDLGIELKWPVTDEALSAHPDTGKEDGEIVDWLEKNVTVGKGHTPQEGVPDTYVAHFVFGRWPTAHSPQPTLRELVRAAQSAPNEGRTER